MAAHIGFSGQAKLLPSFRADGTIISATAPQLILPQAAPRALLSIQNTSSSAMYLEIGGARAKATVTNGVVTSITVTNAGFGYSIAPRIVLLGGGVGLNGLNLGCGTPGSNSPSNVATAVCVMTGTAPNMSIASITVTNGGSGYSNDSRAAPYVQILNDPNDVFGCATPYVGGVGAGILLPASQNFYEAYSIVTTDAVAIWGGTVGATFNCRYVI